MEVWKKHKVYDDLEISTLGNVRRPSGRVLGVHVDPAGYKRVSVNGEWRRVHQLVMDVFCPQPIPDLVIDHIDENNQNNALDNLQWISNRDNLLKAAKRGKMSHGGGVRKPVVSIDENGNARCWESSAEAARKLNIGDYTIARVLGGTQHEARTKDHSYRFYYIRSTA